MKNIERKAPEGARSWVRAGPAEDQQRGQKPGAKGRGAEGQAKRWWEQEGLSCIVWALGAADFEQ